MYQNIFEYEKCIIPLLQRLSNVEHLTLLLAIDGNDNGPNHFIDGLDLQRDIISYMPNLFQFDFHIRSILKNADHIELDKIRQNFIHHNLALLVKTELRKNDFYRVGQKSLSFLAASLKISSMTNWYWSLR